MNKLFAFIISAVLLTVTPGYSQGPVPPGKLGKISASEQKGAALLKAVHTTNLVNNYDLKYHRLRWLVDPAQPSIRGSVTSYFVATTNDMSSIQFELASVLSADSAFHHNFKVGVTHTGNLISIGLGEIIPQGGLDSITVYYHGNPPQDNGFGSFSNSKHGSVPVLWTLSEPYGASDWWPSKNDLEDKIDSVDIFVAAPNGNKVASNGKFIGEEPYGPNLTVTHWKHEYPIASYLIAIAVTNYIVYTRDFIGGPGNTFPVRNYLYPEDSARNTPPIIQLEPIIGHYSYLFGNYPFALEKYGHCEFGWGGGMEHQTMTFIGDSSFHIEILSHELAHQWFGDKVTCGSWHDIWLNEGFATYCAGLMYEYISPDHFWPIWKNQNISFITNVPGGTVYCDDTTNVNRIFDGRLSYSKGAMVLHQLRWIMGDSAFFTGLRNYLHDPDLSYGFALTADFRAHMEASSGLDLGEYFDNWIYKAGYPSFTIRCAPDDPADIVLTVSQTQSDPSVSFFSLPLPVVLKGGNKDTLVVLQNTYSGQEFHINTGFKVDSVKFDPDYWLISAHNQVVLGVNDLPEGKHLRLQPNPADKILTVEHNLGRLKNIKVFDLTGKEVNIKIEENQQQRLVLNVSGLKPGSYILQVCFDQSCIRRKFMIAR